MIVDNLASFASRLGQEVVESIRETPTELRNGFKIWGELLVESGRALPLGKITRTLMSAELGTYVGYQLGGFLFGDPYVPGTAMTVAAAAYLSSYVLALGGRVHSQGLEAELIHRTNIIRLNRRNGSTPNPRI